MSKIIKKIFIIKIFLLDLYFMQNFLLINFSNRIFYFKGEVRSVIFCQGEAFVILAKPMVSQYTFPK